MFFSLINLKSLLLLLNVPVILLEHAWNPYYCILCDGTKQHVMCEKPSPKHNFKQLMTKVLKEDILDFHNLLRNDIARGAIKGFPKAADMMAMQWDFELELLAQETVRQGLLRPDLCRSIGRFVPADVGQNIIWTNTSQTSRRNLFGAEQWLKEKSTITNDKSQIDSYTGENGNNFTQLIWAKTRLIGCAAGDSSEISVIYLVCNYGPSGNIQPNPVYQRGKPCSKCPANSRCGHFPTFGSLCGEKLSQTDLDVSEEVLQAHSDLDNDYPGAESKGKAASLRKRRRISAWAKTSKAYLASSPQNILDGDNSNKNAVIPSFKDRLVFVFVIIWMALLQ